MGILSRLLGSDKTLVAAGGVIEKTGEALDKIFTSKEEKLTAQQMLERIRQRPAEWAHELNVISAGSANWFNSGWRPALGWVGALGLFFFFVPQYIVASVMWAKACYLALTTMEAGNPVVLPDYPLTADGLMELVVMLLGGAVLRSMDKAEGTAKH